MSQMRVDFGNASARAGRIRRSVSGMTRGRLTPRDHQSTIRANRDSNTVFQMAQTGLVVFSSAVNRGSGVITSVSGAFGTLERMQSQQGQSQQSSRGRSR